MSIRCPKCRKKHDDPYPKRCGCGQSLVTLIVDVRATPEVAGAPPAKPPVAVPADTCGNDW